MCRGHRQRATDDATFAKLIDAILRRRGARAIRTTRAKYYAERRWVDLLRRVAVSYTAGKMYDAGVRKEFPDQVAKPFADGGRKELKVTRHGNIWPWTTVPMHLSAKMKDGKTDRYTGGGIRGIWEKKGENLGF